MPEDSVYTVRHSNRAKRLSLRMSAEGGLEVVLPKGFDPCVVPDIVLRKRRWIERQRRRLYERQALLGAQPSLPERVHLRAVDQIWRVQYVAASGASHLRTNEDKTQLTVVGLIDDEESCRAMLLKWLLDRARLHLVPWLDSLSRQYRLPHGRVTIRRQRTRWGSYSCRGTVSLNCKLLFLPPALVRYVLIHELCHSRCMDHSARFWALVSKLEPSAASARAALRYAWRYVPRWVQEPANSSPR